jgi:hypothetical protein
MELELPEGKPDLTMPNHNQLAQEGESQPADGMLRPLVFPRTARTGWVGKRPNWVQTGRARAQSGPGFACHQPVECARSFLSVR